MTHYTEEMNRLKESLLAMASHAESALTRAMRALVERDDLLAQSVIDDDNIVDQFEVEIDDIAIHSVIEQVERDPEERTRDEVIVELVDVVLAPEELVQSAQILLDAAGNGGTLNIEQPRQKNSQEARAQRRSAQDETG